MGHKAGQNKGMKDVPSTGTLKVGENSRNIQEIAGMKWYEHVMRRQEEYVSIRLLVMDGQPRRRKE